MDFVDTVSHLRGKHAFKFGFEYMDSIYDNNSYNQANGEIKFSTLQDFLLGNPHNGKILIGNPDLIARQHAFAGFFQDDWRVTTRVTLNLGLRYEYDAPPHGTLQVHRQFRSQCHREHSGSFTGWTGCAAEEPVQSRSQGFFAARWSGMGRPGQWEDRSSRCGQSPQCHADHFGAA